jgi:hypothetical protein
VVHSLPCQGQDFQQLGTTILSQGSSLRFEAKGNSMTPFIRDGETIEVVPVAGLDLRIGDIAFYWTEEGHPLAHRLIGKWWQDGVPFVQTRGDNCNRSDRPIPCRQVAGSVPAVYRRGKWHRLDRGLLRMVGIIWSRTPAVRLFLFPVLGRVKRLIRLAAGRQL